ncbi:MAG: hypothetical protein ACLP59_25625 [Bryobacteraceae bacterium]
MHAGGKEFDLPAGRVLVLDREMPHDIIANVSITSALRGRFLAADLSRSSVNADSSRRRPLMARSRFSVLRAL